MGFGDLVCATDDEGKGIRCPISLFVQLSGGQGESASLHLEGRCESCRVRVTVHRYLAGLVFVLSGVEVGRSLIWLGCRFAFDVLLS